jgi:hypothetical protein
MLLLISSFRWTERSFGDFFKCGSQQWLQTHFLKLTKNPHLHKSYSSSEYFDFGTFSLCVFE